MEQTDQNKVPEKVKGKKRTILLGTLIAMRFFALVPPAKASNFENSVSSESITRMIQSEQRKLFISETVDSDFSEFKYNKTKIESSDEDFSESLQNAAQIVRAAARWLAEKYLEFPRWILAPLEKPKLYEYKPLELTPIKPVKGFSSAPQYGRRKPSIGDKTAAQQQIHEQLSHNPGPRSLTVTQNGQAVSNNEKAEKPLIKFPNGKEHPFGKPIHVTAKHAHDLGINDIDVKGTQQANQNKAPGSPKEVRTRITKQNVEQVITNVQELAKSPNLEHYPNYPFPNGMGEAWLDSQTNLLFEIDQDGVLRKVFTANEHQVNYLNNNCK